MELGTSGQDAIHQRAQPTLVHGLPCGNLWSVSSADEVLDFIAIDGTRARELALLQPFQQTVFACCCAQRLIAATGADADHPLARRAVNLAWELVLGDSDEDPEAVLHALAALGDALDQDVLAASLYALATAAGGGAVTAAWAGQRGTDRAFDLVSWARGATFRPLEIDAVDPLVDGEYQAQCSDLNRVSSAPNPAALADMRQLLNRPGFRSYRFPCPAGAGWADPRSA